MYKRYCAKCGKEISGEKSLCEECLEHSLIKKKRSLRICSICGKLKYKNKKFSSKESLIKYISREFKGNVNIDDGKFLIFTESEVIELYFEEKHYVCSDCKKYSNPRSYNYKIQLRGDRKKCHDATKLIIKYVIPVNVKELPEGIDLFFKVNNKEFKKILKILRTLTKNIKITRKLVTYDKQTSKKVYRVTVAARL